ncbi:MAG: VCBS repeat-containing protein [Vicinamibacterales bacterium]
MNIETGRFASGVVIDDFNADGAADLAVTNQNANNVSVLLGDGTGAFKGKTDFPAGGAPQRIEAADLDGDRHIDLVLPITTGNAVAVLFGDGHGRFAEPGLIPVVGGPFMTVVADVNGDGRLDVAVGTQTAGLRRVALLLGNGSRTLSAPSYFGVFESTPTALGVADFNRDGKLDLAAGGGPNVPPGTNNLSILLGDGNGGFSATASFTAGPAPQSMSIADFNGDGFSDIAISNSLPAGTDSTVSVLFGDGQGGFAERLPLEIGVLGRGTGAADFNRDGHLDLVVANSASNSVSVLLGDGQGRFAAKTDFPVGQNPRKLAVGDLNHDGRADIVTPNTGSNNISILINSCSR